MLKKQQLFQTDFYLQRNNCCFFDSLLNYFDRIYKVYCAEFGRMVYFRQSERIISRHDKRIRK